MSRTYFDTLYLILFLSVLCLFTACEQKTQQREANALINESSPYLLQHAHNPVDWYPWGEVAFEKAVKQDKLLIISIGYAACHWCHVMEEESFEDSTVARMMNQHYISVKVDREERPDVDQVYMHAAQLVNGQGGWPLNAIALPDGRPVFAGSYFPKEDWLRIIRQMAELYEKSPERLKLVADQLTKGIRSEEYEGFAVEMEAFEEVTVHQYFQNWLPEIDFEKGGTVGWPKFPVTSKQHFLMQYYYYTANDSAYQAVKTTLKAMATGGIYDHLGGGFARYATDDAWKIPHFEKMLYDNAQLVSLFSDAFRLTKDSLYKKVVYQTLDFLQNEMYSAEGAYYASLDADTEGEEGRFYVWTSSQIDQVLGADAEWYKNLYQVTEKGNWENGKNVLTLSSENTVAPKKLEQARQKLLRARNDREKPMRDEKIITAWNALMLQSLVDAYRAFGDSQFLDMALESAHFLEMRMMERDGQLYRTYKDGVVRISGFLDDYALLIRAYLSLYQLNFDQHWLDCAHMLTEYVIQNFDDSGSPLFYYTSDQQASLIARKKEVHDDVIPSSNAVMAHNLYVLGHLYYRQDYLKRVEEMLHLVQEDMLTYPDAFSAWATVLLQQVYAPYEIAIVGQDFGEKRMHFDQHYLPDVIFLGGDSEKNLPLLEGKLVDGQTYIYVCRNKSCKLPVKVVEAAISQLAH